MKTTEWGTQTEVMAYSNTLNKVIWILDEKNKQVTPIGYGVSHYDSPPIIIINEGVHWRAVACKQYLISRNQQSMGVNCSLVRPLNGYDMSSISIHVQSENNVSAQDDSRQLYVIECGGNPHCLFHSLAFFSHGSEKHQYKYQNIRNCVEDELRNYKQTYIVYAKDMYCKDNKEGLPILVDD